MPGDSRLDKAQNVPEVLAYVRLRIDGQPRRAGRWLLTGSQEATLMQGVSESMAGRVVLQLPRCPRARHPGSACCMGVIPRRLRVRVGLHWTTAGSTVRDRN